MTPLTQRHRQTDSVDMPAEHMLLLCIWRRVFQDLRSAKDDVRAEAVAFLADTDALTFWAEHVFLIPLEQLETAIQATLHP